MAWPLKVLLCDPDYSVWFLEPLMGGENQLLQAVRADLSVGSNCWAVFWGMYTQPNAFTAEGNLDCFQCEDK